MEERIYTVPLGDAYEAVRNKRAPKAIKILREFITRNMKAKDERILLSAALNDYIWERSIQKPPRRVKVRLVKDTGKISAYLADEKVEKEEKKKAEEKPEKKEEQEAKAEEKPKEEKKTEEKKEAKPEKEKPKDEKEEVKKEPEAKEAPKEEKK